MQHIHAVNQSPAALVSEMAAEVAVPGAIKRLCDPLKDSPVSKKSRRYQEAGRPTYGLSRERIETSMCTHLWIATKPFYRCAKWLTLIRRVRKVQHKHNVSARAAAESRHVVYLMSLVAGMPLVAEIISERPVHDRSWKMVNL